MAFRTEPLHFESLRIIFMMGVDTCPPPAFMASFWFVEQAAPHGIVHLPMNGAYAIVCGSASHALSVTVVVIVAAGADADYLG